MVKETTTSLPAYTTVDNLFKLIDALKKRNGNEEEAKSIFGMGSSAFNNTKSVLRTFGLIEEDSCTFMPKGRTIAYSKDADKKDEFKKVVMKFFPYESLMSNIFQKGNVEATTVEEITNFWGRFKYGSTQRNLQDAAKLFMSIMDYLGFGNYVIGRMKNPTRIVWDTNARQIFEDAMPKSDVTELHKDKDEIENMHQEAELQELSLSKRK